jgi:hypothetical protein
MGLVWIAILVPLYVVAGWVAVTWIRARHPVRRGESDLEARVMTLERIITDRRRRLREEIDRLGD